MKRSLRIVVSLAFAANLAAALLLVGPGLLATRSDAAPPAKTPPAAVTAPAATAPDPEALSPVGEETPDEAPAIEDSAATGSGPVPAAIATDDVFARLKRAYENMEPEMAARAVRELAARDREAVVALLLGFNARTAGAILDGLTESDPALAADLSYEIWKRSGKSSPPATAGNGR